MPAMRRVPLMPEMVRSSSSSNRVVVSQAAGRCASSLALVLALAASVAQAQAPEVTVYDEQGKLLRGSDVVGTLGSDLFGEQVSLYTGSVEFVQTDVSIPGNSALPVSVGRRFRPMENLELAGHFGDWDLDIPHAHGVFANSVGWAATWGSRCSQFSEPPSEVVGLPLGGNVTMTADSFWQGNFIYLPGQGDQEILVRASNNAAPTDTSTYPLTTKAGGMIRCTGSGASEGFELKTPDGTLYRFTHIVKRRTSPLSAGSAQTPGSDEAPPVTEGVNGSLNRAEVWILPTTIEDRYGNKVNYAWNDWKLLSVTTTPAVGAVADARQLTFTHEGNRIKTATAQWGSSTSRTWTYVYSNNRLWKVQRPDGSEWVFEMPKWTTALMDAPEPSDCDYSWPGAWTVKDGKMTHPSGAVGYFEVTQMEHGRSWVTRDCRNVYGSNFSRSWSAQPRQYGGWSLTLKKLSGAGLPPAGHSWTYAYEALGQQEYCWDPASLTANPRPLITDVLTCTASSRTTRTVTVTDPENVSTYYTFGIRAQVNEGQLLKVETGGVGANAKRTVQTTYELPSVGPWPNPLGTSIQLRGDSYMSTRLFPEKARSTTQDGATFNWTVQNFDTRGRPLAVVKSSTLGYSKAETTAYHDNTSKWILGQVASLTVQSSGSTWYPVTNTYDATTANLLSHSRYGKLHRSYVWHLDGTLHKSMDARGSSYTTYTTTYTGYKRGVPTRIDFPYAPPQTSGDWLTTIVNDTGEIESVTQSTQLSPLQTVTTGYQYDLIGRLKQIDYPSASPAWNATTLTFARETTPELNNVQHWVQTVNQGAARTRTYYDALWRPVLTKRFDTGTESDTRRMTLTQYDGTGRVRFESYPQRQITSVTENPRPPGIETTYDALGRVATTVAGSELGLLTTRVAYLTDLGGFRKRVTNPRSFRTITTFQAFDEPVEDAPVKVLLPDDGEILTYRDVLGKPVQLTQTGPLGAAPTSTRTYTYDAHQRLCKTVEPESGAFSQPNGATVQGYDLADNLVWQATGQTASISCLESAVAPNQKATMTYDARNRLLSTTHGDPGTQGSTRTWTSDGKLATVTAGGTTWTYTYNSLRKLKSESLSYGGTSYPFTYEYDANGHLRQRLYPDGILINYGPNALGEPTYAGTYASNIKFHPNGALKSFLYGNGIQHTMVPNERGLPQSVTDMGVIDDQYVYDENGNVEGITDMTFTPNATLGRNLSRTMAYDSRDRLTLGHFVDLSPANDMESRGVGHSYDMLDNIKSNVTMWRNFDYIYDSKQRLTKIQNMAPPYSWVDYSYDTRGNATARSVTDPVTPANSSYHTFVYDQKNRLKTVTVSGTSTTYGYDGNDRRVTITPPTGVTKLQLYSQEGQFLYEIRPSTGTGQNTYVYLGRHLLARVGSNSLGGVGGIGGARPVFFQHTDGVGSPMAVTNSAGALSGQRTVYEPYGDLPFQAETDGPGFTGHVSDAVTGLTYMQARFYDPVAARFLSVDPVAASAQSVNRYWYANNNPYKYVDPDGRFAQFVWGAAVGAGVEIFVQTAIQGKSFSEIDLTNVAVAAGAGAITGGIASASALAAARGTASVTQAVLSTAAGSGATGVTASIARDFANGETPSVSGALIEGGASAVLGGAGQRLTLAPMAALENMASKSGLGATIADTTRSAIIGSEAAALAGATSASGAAVGDALNAAGSIAVEKMKGKN